MFFLILVIGKLMAVEAYAQDGTNRRKGTLRGKVVIQEAQYSDECADIMVRIKGTQLTAITDSEGRFEIKGIPYGKYDLLLQSIFITPKEIKLHIHQPLTTIKEVVQANAELLAEVVIEGASTQRKIELSGFSVDVVQPDELAKYSLSTTEILDRLPGMRIRQSGGQGSRQNININGMSGNAIRTFINGVPQSNYGGSFSLRSIPSSMIERVEVYKGVVPAYLSEDALGGAINIVLKKKVNNQMVLSYSAGSFHTHNANIYGSYYLGRGFVLSLSGYYNYSKNDYWVWGDGVTLERGDGQIIQLPRARRFHDGYNDYGTRVALSLNDQAWVDQLSLNMVFSKGYKEIQTGNRMNRVYGNRHRNSRMWAAELSYQKSDILIDGLELDAMLSYTNNIRQVVDTIPYRYDWSGKPIKNHDGTPLVSNFGAEVRNPLTGGPSLQVDDAHSLMLRLGIGYTFLKHHTILARYQGNSFWRDSSDEILLRMKAADPSLKLPDERKSTFKSVFSLTEESSWLGGRLKSSIFYKHFRQHIKAILQLNYGSGLKDTPINDRQVYHGFGGTLSYRLMDKLYLHASSERAIRLPTDLELFGNATANIIYNEKGLRPERSDNYNIGFNGGDYQIGPVRINGGVTFFVRDTKDMIRESITIGTNDVDYSKFENIESIWTRGFDSDLSVNIGSQFNISASYSLFIGLFNTKIDKNGMPHSLYRVPLKNEPSRKGNVNMQYMIPDLFAKGNTLTLGANLNYVGKFSVDWPIYGSEAHGKAYVPRQNPIDLSLNYSFWKGTMSISLDAKNILDQQLFDNFALQKPGRAFYGKLTYRIK